MNLITPVKASTPVTAEIERLGFSWHEDQNFDLERLSSERRVQVRESDHYAPPGRVAEYACQMAQSIFPPIVVSADDYLVDGATRAAAYAIRKQRFAPAYIVKASFASAVTTAKLRNNFFVLGVTLNQQGGERLTAKEAIARMPSFLALGWKFEQISRATGLCEIDIKRLKREHEIRQRLEKVGLPHEDLQPAKILSLRYADNLNNEPFKQLVVLTADAGLKPKEISKLAKDAGATGSDDGALKHIAGQRAELNDRIKMVALTGVPVKHPSTMLRMHLGVINSYEGREPELIETDPAQSEKHLEAISKAIAVLMALKEMQQ